MSLNLDDWLKPSDVEEVPDQTSNPVVDPGVGVDDDDEDPIGNSLTAADLQLPDLGLPDIKWWVDLEFLDLASGPPANFNSNQEKNKNKHNPTLGYHFPDIFFDTTAGQGITSSSTSNLFGSADDTHRSLIGDQTFENFEKGILNLADLFPTTSTGNEDKLLDDFADDATAPSTSGQATSSTEPTNSEPISPIKIVVDDAGKGNDDDIEDHETTKPNSSGNNVVVDDDAYSVPIDVLQTISKNFEKLQADFENSAPSTAAGASLNINSTSGSTSTTTGTGNIDENRVIRIKSIRTVPPEANIEEDVERPAGTVATIAIQTNKANNTTTFTILPRIGTSPGHSFLVKTHNLSQATKLIRPLHLDRLPVFKSLFHHNNIKVVPPTGTETKINKAKKENIEQQHQRSEKKPAVPNFTKNSPIFDHPRPKIETLSSEFINELKEEHDIEYEKIDIYKSEENGKLNWHCPEQSCSRIFPKRSQLKLHIFSHKKVKPFKCSLEGCDWSFPTLVRLKRHEKCHEGLKLFKCTWLGCDRSFTTVYNLNAHIKDHAQNGLKFQCNLCELTFHCQRNLDLHLRNGHGKEAALEVVKNDYSCKECPKVLFTKADYVRHIKNCGNNLDLKCFACDKEFKTLSKLKTHEMIHNGQRPYACQTPGCNWAFRTSSKLRRHERTHQNDRRYQCSQCKKAYLRLEHLREHFEVVHRNQRLACPYEKCESRFTHRAALVSHVKKHREDPTALESRSLRCVMEKCGKKFQSRRNLSHHVNKEHRIPEKLGSSSVSSAGTGQDQSELDLIALLSCVAEEDLKLIGKEHRIIAPENNCDSDQELNTELITVDASAITPVKNQNTSEENSINRRKRNRPMPKASILKRKKICNRIELQVIAAAEASSTINMQDLV